MEFQAHLEAACEALATDAPRRAVSRIESGPCSDDGFDGFALRLVARGRETCKAVLADPDTLADIAGVRAPTGRSPQGWCDEEWPEWEALDYVALEAVRETWARPGDEPTVTEAGARIRTPRLDALFPVEAGP
ncbi:DUF4240 domain-containing protein [Streptomyces sp. NPDC002669]|uniref:DUF4240 domain-containing protein n=1 Tax=Streptomyces sp. NPDC002669 TaxID=3364658 RepID=UPI003681C015